MKFSEVVTQTLAWLQRDGRVSYRALKREFDLDDEFLEDVKAELIEAKRVAIDENGKVLVWMGDDSLASSVQSLESKSPRPPIPSPQTLDPRLKDSRLNAGERRQLTVMFCDLVGSTALSEQLDPEDLRKVVRAYQETCTTVIRRYDGHLAQYLGDGLLVYFGYPVAHEDDAQRAVRTGLEIVSALQSLSSPSPFQGEGRSEGNATTQPLESPHSSPLPQGARGLQVRIGIHTGLVVIGEIGSSEKCEILALGETPNIAARLQGLAEPDTVAISAVTQRLVAGLFESQDLGPQTLKGFSIPLSVYQVKRESTTQSRFEAAVSKGLTPLVGREEELGLLRRRWEQAKTGEGQVVLLSGEPGIGKSRLVQTLKEHVMVEGATRIEFRCSPYHQNSAFYPIIEHLQRLLQFERADSPQAKLTKLQQALAAYRFPRADTLPLLATLLSLPQPEGIPPLTLSPQKQKQKTQEALVAWIVEEAEKAAVYCAWEDLHWIDPSSLDVLTLVLDQAPTTRLLALLTFRPEFTSPWGNRSHLSQMTLSRLGSSQVEAMVERVAGGKALPAEVVQQIVAKTDGVPLFVEELTKMVVESEFDVGARHAMSLQALGIPATLQDALMARLDRLGPTKEIAQLGATIGREFSYDLLAAVSSLDEEKLQHGLKQLVEAELVYQRGLLPQANYLFKHALIQDTAYQSLLKSTRQQYHRQIAQVLEERFPETQANQPELLAHHYTEAGLIKQAIPYWQRAGERASQHSAYMEAIAHLTKGLELLQPLPDTPERVQQELTLQLALAAPLIITKGYTVPAVERVYTRALELCRQLGETPQLFSTLVGLWTFHLMRAEYKTARELAEQCLSLAQNAHNPLFLLGAHLMLGDTLFWLGEFALAQEHLEEGIALYDPQQHRSSQEDPGVVCLCYATAVLWLLGYADQALQRSHGTLTLAQKLSHPYSLVYALSWAAVLHLFRQEVQATQEWAEAAIALSTEHGFPHWLASGTMWRGWALAEQGRGEEGITQIRQGLAAYRAMGAEQAVPYFLALLAEAYGKVGQAEEGLSTLSEALMLVNKTGARWYEAELYRLKGELLLAQEGLREKTEEAEECFLRAIAVARKQEAKSLELRAVMSLGRLWQQQGKKDEACQMLAEIYNWFTEGFDTKDLQDAKALLEELRH
ncbi:MAG: AAA family ATPase [Deltaproteobacteria bacterium]|nr:AAA family ATPase [Deltaproteobacteria bacterium]